MKKITKLVCVAMALVILVCSTNGATASAAKRIYFAGDVSLQTWSRRVLCITIKSVFKPGWKRCRKLFNILSVHGNR